MLIDKAINRMIQVEYNYGEELRVPVPMELSYKAITDDYVPRYVPSVHLVYRLRHITDDGTGKFFYYQFDRAEIR